jgi:biotin carboxyl carrier protein
MNKILQFNGKAVSLDKLEQKAGSVQFELNGKRYRVRACRLDNGTCILEEEMAEDVWQVSMGGVWNSGKNIKTVQIGALEARISDTATAAAASSQSSALSPVAPMPALVRQILVKKGDKVTAGQVLAVIEAMKLQLNLCAGGDAVVDKILVKVGDMVSEGAELVTLTPKK